MGKGDFVIDPSRIAKQLRRCKNDEGLCPLCLDALDALLEELDAARRKEPGVEGGPGKEETYWLRVKLDACVQHLRDIEDFYRIRGGLPESFNTIRADRARSLYEQISEDFISGKVTVPTMRERAEAAEALVGLLREAHTRLLVSEGDARYENRNIELAERIGAVLATAQHVEKEERGNDEHRN